MPTGPRLTVVINSKWLGRLTEDASSLDGTLRRCLVDEGSSLFSVESGSQVGGVTKALYWLCAPYVPAIPLEVDRDPPREE